MFLVKLKPYSATGAFPADLRTANWERDNYFLWDCKTRGEKKKRKPWRAANFFYIYMAGGGIQNFSLV